MRRGGSVTVGGGRVGGRSRAELDWAQNRPVEHRPPLPAPGTLVLYRSNDWGDLQTAEVRRVWWECENGIDNWRMLAIDDRWPMLRLEVHGVTPAAKLDHDDNLYTGSAPPRTTLVDTWEARLQGSAGWLPLDWEQWPRPQTGR